MFTFLSFYREPGHKLSPSCISVSYLDPVNPLMITLLSFSCLWPSCPSVSYMDHVNPVMTTFFSFFRMPGRTNTNCLSPSCISVSYLGPVNPDI